MYSYDRCLNPVYFNTLLLISYLSVIETLFVIEKLSLTGFTSFGFAQNGFHDFRNTLLIVAFDKCHKDTEILPIVKCYR